MWRLLSNVLAVVLLSLPASGARADDAAKAIIAKAIQAHGGAEKLAKLRVRQEKTKLSHESRGQIIISTSDTLVDLPHRWKARVEVDWGAEKSSNVFVINGEKGWANFGKETSALTGDTKYARHQHYVLSLTPLLKDQLITLSALGEVQVNDRPARGVKVVAQDRQDIELYFDKETGLLVKSKRWVPSNEQELILESLYGDYRETDGVKWPRKRVLYRNGKRTGEEEITELKFLDKIDEKEFAKP